MPGLITPFAFIHVLIELLQLFLILFGFKVGFGTINIDDENLSWLFEITVFRVVIFSGRSVSTNEIFNLKVDSNLCSSIDGTANEDGIDNEHDDAANI